MKIKIFTLLLMLFSAFSIFAEPIKNIRFATEASYPPFEYIDQSGQIKGFDIDLARALCEQLKAQCTFTNQSFNSLIPSLKLGKFDAIIAQDPNPFTWAPGLVGNDMSPADFHETIEEVARQHSIILPRRISTKRS